MGNPEICGNLMLRNPLFEGWISFLKIEIPFVSTLLVGAFFFFGLYGLSVAGKFRKLPFLKIGVFLIAGIYLLRGLGEVYLAAVNGFFPMNGIAATLIGLLFLVGGIRKWNPNLGST